MNIWLAGSIAILIALLITPYLWAYDQVLLILPILYIIQYPGQDQDPVHHCQSAPDIVHSDLSLIALHCIRLTGMMSTV